MWYTHNTMSTHEIKVIKVGEVSQHPNADRLELVKVWDYVCVVRKDQYKAGDLAVFIEPDYVVDCNRPEFAFLMPQSGNPDRRITLSRFRGVYSYGLLIDAPEGASEGDNVIDHFGITRWEPDLSVSLKGALAERGPEVITPKYDLENLKKYHYLLKPNEKVIVTGKIHGSNARYLYTDGRMWSGSRTQWKMPPGKFMDGYKGGAAPTPECAWWKGLRQNPWIEEFCSQNPGTVLYGEIYGTEIQGGKFHYGIDPNKIGFAVFDIFEKARWLPNSEFGDARFDNLEFVETLYKGKYNTQKIAELAETKETFNNCKHIREGVVVKLQKERVDMNIGRVALKYVSNQYYEKGAK